MLERKDHFEVLDAVLCYGILGYYVKMDFQDGRYDELDRTSSRSSSVESSSENGFNTHYIHIFLCIVICMG